MADDVRSDAQGENHELTDVDEEAGHERLSPGAAPREMYIPQDEATAFIESLMEQEGFWEGVGEKGCALFPGLRWIYTANVTAPGGRHYWTVEGTSENLLLAVCTREDGTMSCQSREDLAERGWDRARIEVAYEEHRAFAENMRRMVEGDPWSIRDKPLLVRCEHDSGGYACRVLIFDEENVGDVTSLSWWQPALSHERVLELDARREAARAVEQAGDHENAVVAYDDILGVLDGALRDPALGPCCATQALLAKCLFSRASCRLALGGRDNLRSAFDDSQRALTNSRHSGWLRAGLDEDAVILADDFERLRGRMIDAMGDLSEALAARPRATHVDGVMDWQIKQREFEAQKARVKELRLRLTCTICGAKPKTLLNCPCGTTQYCTVACQRIDWRERGHRQACKKIRDERAAEAARAEAPTPPRRRGKFSTAQRASRRRRGPRASP
ncbi:hypothetical protein JL721_548 [Aureococcus anophagefferens]|nr:hypothetical protein JL721_548 [Aureococcus anophagefferens]